MKKELQQYEIEPDAMWEEWHYEGYDGYEIMQFAENIGWHAIAGWGKDGWGLGNWPYVVVYSHKRLGDGYEIVIYVEGDITAYAVPSKEIRNQIIDEIVFFYWKHSSAAPDVSQYETVEQLPPELRGPCRA